jgi:pimeloyl-ACP methyl ester carboxylesterase
MQMQRVNFSSETYGLQHYYLAGQHENVIVLVHGFAEDATIFKKLSDSLSDAYTVITINLPGSGGTKLTMQETTMAYFADYVAAVLMHCKQHAINSNFNKILIAGHSMGGYISLAYAEKHPDKCVGISLMHSTIFADDDAKKENRIKALELVKNGGKEQFLKALIKNLFTDNFYANNAPIIQQHFEMANSMHENTIASYYNGMMNRKDYKTFISNLKIPLQFIIGDLDKIIALNISLNQSYIANTSMVNIITNCGHTSMLEHPQRLQKHLLQISNFSFM